MLGVIADFNEITLPGAAPLRRGPAARADHARVPRPVARAARRPGPDRRRRARARREDRPSRQPFQPRGHGLGDRGGLACCCRSAWRTLGWDAVPILLVTGAVMCVVNFGTGSAIFVPLFLGRPVSLLPRMFFSMLPTALIMVMLAALTAILVPSLGVAALAIFALIAVLPQTALTHRRPHPPGRVAGPADRDAPLLARARAAPRARPRGAPPPRARHRPRLRAPRRGRRPDRLRPPDAARPVARVLGGRPRG